MTFGEGYVARDVHPTDDGGFILVGHDTHPHATIGPRDVLLVKIDAAGLVEWSRTYDNAHAEEGRGVRPSGDGGYIVAGYTGGPVFDLGLTNNATELLIFKVDASGNVLWRRLLSDDTLTTGYGIDVDAGGSFVVAGSLGRFVPGDRGALLLRFDPEGNELWRRRFELGDALIPWGVIHCADGGYALVAHVNGPDASARRRDVCVFKTDADGEEEWTFVGGDDLGLAGDRVGRGIVQTRDDGYAITGGASTRNAGDLFVAKLDSGGGLSWVTRPRGALDTDGYDLLEAEDGSLIASGASYVAGGFQSCMRFYAARFSASGAVQWTGRFAGGAWDAATAVGQRADGTFLLAGYTAPDVFAPFSIYLITTDAGQFTGNGGEGAGE